MGSYLTLLLVAATAALLLTPVVRRVAIRYQIITPVRDRDIHVVAMPRLGGIALTAGVIAALVVGYFIPGLRIAYTYSPALWAVLLGSLAVCILGALDDAIDLRWHVKLTGQVVIAVLMTMNGIQLSRIPLLDLTLSSPIQRILVSALVLVMTMNAVNFVDGLDGLAAGLLTIGSITLFVYSFLLLTERGPLPRGIAATILTISLAGTCLGFLRYNFYPAKIFMGDSGSMVLGLVLGSATILVFDLIRPLTLAGNPAISGWILAALPIVIFMIPLLDLLITPTMRVLRGKNPVVADKTHLHHRLLEGHTHRATVLILYGWTMLACAMVIALLIVPPLPVLVAAIPIMIFLTIVTFYRLPGQPPASTD